MEYHTSYRSRKRSLRSLYTLGAKGTMHKRGGKSKEKRQQQVYEILGGQQRGMKEFHVHEYLEA